MATFTYDTTSPGPANGSPSPQLHTVHLLEAYTSDPRSDEEPQHHFPMPMHMPMPLFSASGNLSKDAAGGIFADFSALPSTFSGLDDINCDEWILFDSSPVDVTPPSLQLLDFSDDPIEEAHSSPSDVADDPPNRRSRHFGGNSMSKKDRVVDVGEWQAKNHSKYPLSKLDAVINYVVNVHPDVICLYHEFDAMAKQILLGETTTVRPTRQIIDDRICRAAATKLTPQQAEENWQQIDPASVSQKLIKEFVADYL
ncbi:hypothetical protein ACJ73_09860 [Blastomyces percursus]|uniref:Uncharacterized protein n=1 Tax=Blastomyces percursus TaxID=1658174 RepID=A0A1J9Q1X9_9EURO|nr:hypothetical protein ACJ73_09860 [Blastomyces percursus]